MASASCFCWTTCFTNIWSKCVPLSSEVKLWPTSKSFYLSTSFYIYCPLIYLPLSSIIYLYLSIYISSSIHPPINLYNIYIHAISIGNLLEEFSSCDCHFALFCHTRTWPSVACYVQYVTVECILHGCNGWQTDQVREPKALSFFMPERSGW